jgi:pimeloyl-ACP methyl ester carboxylesterase
MILLVAEIFGSIAAAIAVLLGAGLLYRAVRQLGQRRALRLRTADRIVEGGYVQIRGVAQWVQIRGEHRSNPVLLVLHGGPGIAFSAFSPRFRPWERDFTVVQWDQPGAGKTLSRNGQAGTGALSIDGMVEDGIQMTEWVLRRLDQPRLILFGVSWGTVLGTLMVKRRPDLFSAYVGAGQFVAAAEGEPVGYALALEQARRLGDAKAIEALQTIGPPPYADMKSLSAERRAMGRVSVDTFPNARAVLSAILFAPGYTLRDARAFLSGVQYSAAQLLGALMDYDARRLGAAFETPLFFFQGGQDLYTPARTVQEYVATLQAPHKVLVVWENEGHLTTLSNPTMVLRELVARVRPLVLEGTPT